MRISDWSSDVCSSDLEGQGRNRPSRRREWRVSDVFSAKPLRIAAIFRMLDLKAASAGLRSLNRNIACTMRSEARRVGKKCVLRLNLGGGSIIIKKKQVFILIN